MIYDDERFCLEVSVLLSCLYIDKTLGSSPSCIVIRFPAICRNTLLSQHSTFIIIDYNLTVMLTICMHKLTLNPA